MVVPSIGRRAVITAAAMCGLMWVERGNRVSIDAPISAEITLRAAASACPNNDSVPYTASCLAFMGSSDEPNWDGIMSSRERWRSLATSKHSSECPDNDNEPYPPGCVTFLSGWFWRLSAP